jgi:hypothetical protein
LTNRILRRQGYIPAVAAVCPAGGTNPFDQPLPGKLVTFSRKDLPEMTAILNKDEVTKTVADTARMICAEQPGVGEPKSIRDLDSFSFVQIALELETIYGVKLIEDLEDFEGENFEDLAEAIVQLAANSDDDQKTD